jgi:hypothetical protein
MEGASICAGGDWLCYPVGDPHTGRTARRLAWSTATGRRRNAVRRRVRLIKETTLLQTPSGPGDIATACQSGRSARYRARRQHSYPPRVVGVLFDCLLRFAW